MSNDDNAVEAVDAWADPFKAVSDDYQPGPWYRTHGGNIKIAAPLCLSEKVPFPGTLKPSEVMMVGHPNVDQVKWVQGRLNAIQASEPTVVDGDYGYATMGAVAGFQSSLGLRPTTGWVDAKTLEALKSDKPASQPFVGQAIADL